LRMIYRIKCWLGFKDRTMKKIFVGKPDGR